MGARTPDAYRIGAGQVTQEYPADAVPARLRKQPSLPTMSRAPESSPVEQVGTADNRQTEHFASGFVIEKNDFRPAGGHRCGGDNFAVPARADDGELLTGCQHVFLPTVSITEAV